VTATDPFHTGPDHLPSWRELIRWRAFLTSEHGRRLGQCLLIGLVVALITGPSGSITNTTGGISGSLLHPRVVVFLALGVLLWVALTSWNANPQARAQVRSAGESTTRFFAVPRIRYSTYGALLVLALVVPPILNTFWQSVAVDQIGLYVLLALGLNVVVGFAGLLDLGYIAFYAIGAYTAAYFTGSLPVQPPVVLNPFWTFPLAVVAAIIAGVVLGAPTLRLRGDYLAIVTLGFGEIIQIVARNLTSITGGPQGVNKAVPHFSVHLGGLNYKWTLSQLPYYYLLLVLVVIVLVGVSLLERSRVGRAWVAIREDEVAAQACGINTLKYKVLAFAIGASTSGFAGVLFAGKNNFFDPGVFTVQLSILVLVLVIFGGMGSLVGVVLGASFLQYLQWALRNYIPQQDLFVYVGAILVAMMVFRPQGLIPSRRRSREIRMAEAGLSGADALGAAGGP
jgi:branched-chain amino acid transport system permease protein